MWLRELATGVWAVYVSPDRPDQPGAYLGVFALDDGVQAGMQGYEDNDDTLQRHP